MAELFKNSQEFIPGWGNECLEEDLVEAVDVFEQQHKKKPWFAL